MGWKTQKNERKRMENWFGWVTILRFYAMLPIHVSLFGATLKRHIQTTCAPSMAFFQ
jgi:hypothetical protein